MTDDDNSFKDARQFPEEMRLMLAHTAILKLVEKISDEMDVSICHLVYELSTSFIEEQIANGHGRCAAKIVSELQQKVAAVDFAAQRSTTEH